MSDYTFGFIGAGRITKILLGGFERAGSLPQQVVVTDSNQKALDALLRRFPNMDLVFDDTEKPSAQDLVFLALPPRAMGAVLNEIRSSICEETIVVALAPNVTIDTISEHLGGFKRIIRLLPNAPSIVNAGFNPMVFSSVFASEEKHDILAVFRVLGECPEAKEETIEAYAITTAMGPTYFWFQLDELRKLGESFGLTSDDLHAALNQMVIGTAKTMFESGLSPTEVMDLIPGKPLSEDEPGIRSIYETRLNVLFDKLKA